MQINKIVADKNFGIDPDGLQPFVFKRWAIKEGDRRILPVDIEGGEVLAVPFEKFSIEMDGGEVLTRGDLRQAGVSLEGNVDLMCIAVQELGVNDFEFHVLTRLQFPKGSGRKDRWVVSKVCRDEVNSGTVDGVGNVKAVDVTGEYTDLYTSVMGVVRQYISRLHEKSVDVELGVLENGDGSRCKVGGTKRKWKPTGVIYVGARRTGGGGDLVDAAGRRLRVLAGWRVRGHWRKLVNSETLGKDRHGDRVVRGWTWIGEYSKGDLAGGSGSGIGAVRKV